MCDEGSDAVRRLFAIVFAALLVSALLAFPADTNAYARCNCTAWAKHKRPDLPMNLGHAKTWGVRAKAQGYPVDGKPRVGDVIVLQPGVQGAHRRYGHVAYVIGVRGNRVIVSEMNGGQGCKVVRDSFRITKGVAFIHPRPKKAKG